MTEVGNTGLFEGIELKQYLAWDAVSSGTLGYMMRTASFCRYRLDHPEEKEDSDATRFGSAIHCALLEADQFDSRYALDPQSPKYLDGEIPQPYPKGWRNTNDYKDKKRVLAARNYVTLPQEHLDACRVIQEKAQAHKAASRILSAIEYAEASVIVEDPDTGLLLKIRPDALCGDVVVHVKTTRSAGVREFEREIWTRGYHRDLAFYADVLDIAFPGKYAHHVFLIPENTAPFDIAVRALEPAAMELGRMEYRAYLEQFWACTESNDWPGYSEEIEPCGVPKWAYYTEED